MNIFSTNKIDNTPSGLRKETEGVLDVFRKTVSNLENLANRAIEEKKAKDVQIEVLAQESKELEVIATNNQAIIGKFNKLLSV